MSDSSAFMLDDFLAYKLVKTAAHVADALARVYQQEFDISRPEWRILASLGAREGIKAKDLATETGLDKVKVSRTLVGLEERGLLCKTRDPQDQRAAYLHLTCKGRSLYNEIVPRAKAWEEEMLVELSSEHYQIFITTLDNLLKQTEEDKNPTI